MQILNENIISLTLTNEARYSGIAFTFSKIFKTFIINVVRLYGNVLLYKRLLVTLE